MYPQAGGARFQEIAKRRNFAIFLPAKISLLSQFHNIVKFTWIELYIGLQVKSNISLDYLFIIYLFFFTLCIREF